MATGFSVTELTLILEDMTLSRYYTSDRDELSSSFSSLLYANQKFFWVHRSISSTSYIYSVYL